MLTATVAPSFGADDGLLSPSQTDRCTYGIPFSFHLALSRCDDRLQEFRLLLSYHCAKFPPRIVLIFLHSRIYLSVASLSMLLVSQTLRIRLYV